MQDKLDRSVWINYFNEFTRRNHSRLSQLEIFGENGAQAEEHGLPFTGICLERGNGAPSVAIMFDACGPSGTRHLTHMIDDVERITPKRGLDGCDEALEIIAGGETNLLRFEQSRTIGGA